MISNVNDGICHRRVQTGEPCFFVNWTENGENKYRFFGIVSAMESFKSRLKSKVNNEEYR